MRWWVGVGSSDRLSVLINWRYNKMIWGFPKTGDPNIIPPYSRILIIRTPPNKVPLALGNSHIYTLQFVYTPVQLLSPKILRVRDFDFMCQGLHRSLVLFKAFRSSFMGSSKNRVFGVPSKHKDETVSPQPFTIWNGFPKGQG